jgi:hypothetical protein
VPGTLDARTSLVHADVSALQHIIRQRIDARALPEDAGVETCWAGKSAGGRCSGCDQPIQPEDNEYEVAMGERAAPSASLLFHRACLDIWIAECRHRAAR